MKYSSTWARLRIGACCASIENCCTCPSRKLASGIPVLATPGRSVNRLLNVNDPVGDGGWITFSRSHRRSAPNLNECRPVSHVNESAICVTLVLKSDAVFAGEPSCWWPEMRMVGNVFGNCAFDGMPGSPRTDEGGPSRVAALRS